MLDKETDEKLLNCVDQGDLRTPLKYVEKGKMTVDHEFLNIDTGLRFPLIWVAVEENDLDVARRLIELGSNVNKRWWGGDMTLLCSAAAWGHREMVDLLVGAGADVNVPSNSVESTAETPLMAAAEAGSTEIVRNLLAAGADPSAKDGGGHTAMFPAARAGSRDVMTLLFDAGCPVTGDCLHCPIERREADIVLRMLEQKPDVNVRWPIRGSGVMQGDLPLMLALRRTQDEVLAARYPDHPMPSRSDRIKIIRALLDAGADLYATEEASGYTPLIVAVDERDAEIVRILVEAGADPAERVPSPSGGKVSALRKAENFRNQELLEALQHR